jgi:hypothetical protein
VVALVCRRWLPAKNTWIYSFILVQGAGGVILIPYV